MSRSFTAVYQRTIPQALAADIPEHGRRRVLAAIAAELEVRTPAELAERIRSRWQAWWYRTEDITDPVAVAITIVRRGYHCPDVLCEGHVRLDTGIPCGACSELAAQITRRRLSAVTAQRTDYSTPATTCGPPITSTSHPQQEHDSAAPSAPIPQAASLLMRRAQTASSGGPPSQAWLEAMRRRDYGMARAVLDRLDPALRRSYGEAQLVPDDRGSIDGPRPDA